jgi:hypothetical protein
MRRSIVLASVAAAAVLASAATSRADSLELSLVTLFDQAQRDFEASYAEAGLSGTAPFVGLARPADGRLTPSVRSKAAKGTKADKPQSRTRASAINRSTIRP